MTTCPVCGHTPIQWTKVNIVLALIAALIFGAIAYRYYLNDVACNDAGGRLVSKFIYQGNLVLCIDRDGQVLHPEDLED